MFQHFPVGCSTYLSLTQHPSFRAKSLRSEPSLLISMRVSSPRSKSPPNTPHFDAKQPSFRRASHPAHAGPGRGRILCSSLRLRIRFRICTFARAERAGLDRCQRSYGWRARQIPIRSSQLHGEIGARALLTPLAPLSAPVVLLTAPVPTSLAPPVIVSCTAAPSRPVQQPCRQCLSHHRSWRTRPLRTHQYHPCNIP